MLKSKKALYVLLPLNLVIWTYFVFRISSGSADSEPKNTFVIPSNKDKSHEEPPAKLSLSYEDPFLKNRTLERKQYRASKKQLTEKQMKEIKSAEKAPLIIYHGLIKNNHTGITTALITVDGNSQIVRTDESFKGVQFKKISRDSIVAEKGRQRIIVKRSPL